MQQTKENLYHFYKASQHEAFNDFRESRVRGEGHNMGGVGWKDGVTLIEVAPPLVLHNVTLRPQDELTP